MTGPRNKSQRRTVRQQVGDRLYTVSRREGGTIQVTVTDEAGDVEWISREEFLEGERRVRVIRRLVDALDVEVIDPPPRKAKNWRAPDAPHEEGSGT